MNNLCNTCTRLWESKGQALHFAASHGHIECTRELLDLGADTKARDEDRNTPVHLALLMSYFPDYLECARLIIAKDASLINYVGNRSYPLHIICSQKYTQQVFECFQEIIAAGANIHVEASDGYTPLHDACDYGNEIFIRELIRLGADVNAYSGDNFGDTPLILAMNRGSLNCVKILEESGVDVNAIHDSQNILHGISYHYALEETDHEEFLECVLYIIEKMGANVNVQDDKGNTPLHYAAITGSAVCAKVLLDHGADPFFINNKGYTALDIALDVRLRNKNYEPNESEKTFILIRDAVKELEIPTKCAV